MTETRQRITAAVTASKTTLTEIYGVGPIVAATVIGDVVEVARFANRDHFASYNGTAPIEVSSGHRKIYRLSRRGNRRLNHAIHMAAVHPDSPQGKRRSHLLRPQDCRRQDRQRSAAIPQATHQ
jgi:transposase